jgi:hypothetical protein
MSKFFVFQNEKKRNNTYVCTYMCIFMYDVILVLTGVFSTVGIAMGYGL